MILETPKGVEAGQELDVINLGVLRGLLEGEEPPKAGRGKRQGVESAWRATGKGAGDGS